MKKVWSFKASMTDISVGEYLQVAVTVKVADPAELWKAAEQVIVNDGCTDPAEIEELIGTVEKPFVSTCIETVLAERERLPGCEYEDVVIHRSNKMVSDVVICKCPSPECCPGAGRCQWAEQFGSSQ